ncbi:OsmC family protein [Arhodomonas aquaeolei]|uniref:OsmC family protein n=1 Tax=Arhodomonas aquaeolei TaxID=2369 RepID=UPI0004782DEF|nr:OsmC family protein [Arhodomonas aquaeolei]
MHATVSWLGKMAFRGETGSGHEVLVDGPPDLGGEERGARPMELMLLSLGSCSAVDVVHILRKGRHDVVDCVVEVNGERAEEPPKVFTRIHLHYRVVGRDLRESVVARAVSLSAEKYCSASLMLSQAAEITHDFEVAQP